MYVHCNMEMPKMPIKVEMGDFIDDCIEIVWAKEDVDKWMTRQAVRCLRSVYEVRVSWHEQKTCESYLRRIFYDK